MATENTTAKPKKSKTDQAIDYLNANRDKGVTPYEAAHALGIAPATIYKRIKLLADTSKPRCPCCGQAIKVAA